MKELKNSVEGVTNAVSEKATASTGLNTEANPKPSLGLTDAIALIVGIVIGAGIFRTPSLVASNTESNGIFLLVWFLGGLVSLIGALCYAELSTAFPHTGGDYHFLTRAFGKRLAFLFAWARMSVIQTGSIALLAFIFGDYLSQIYNLGPSSSVIYAGLVVIALTGINIMGVRFGSGTQKLLTFLEVAGILIIIVTGIFFAPDSPTTIVDQETTNSTSTSGLAMIAVLLTFGGWNEAAYLSGEMRSGAKHMATALILGITIITVVYILTNFSYLNVLGHQGISKSSAVASDLMRVTWGQGGILLISALVAISALTSANATIFTGARTNYALGKDFPVFSFLGHWDHQKSAPTNAYIVQGLISLTLISVGIFTRSGFETMLEYTAPVFWFFFLLVGVSLFILRRKEPDVKRPFRVPFYPITPTIFCMTSAYLLYSSVVYTGLGALVGIGVLLIGVLLLLIIRRKTPSNTSRNLYK